LSLRFALLPLLIITNLLALVALMRGIAVWAKPAHRRYILTLAGFFVFILNLPLVVFFFPSLDYQLGRIPPNTLRDLFYPSAAWMATLIIFFTILVLSIVPGIVWATLKGIGHLFSRVIGKKFNVERCDEIAADQTPEVINNSRRKLLASAPGIAVAGIFGISTAGVYSGSDEIEVSNELAVPIRYLPRSLEGLSIVQLSDIHVGPYIRERDLERIVSLTNDLHPDLIVVTGDVLDRHLSSLPDAVRGLRGLKAQYGIFAVLGNHDYYADRYSRNAKYRGGIKIAEGLDAIGIRTLRNEVAHIDIGSDRLAMLGLDWLTTSPNDRSFYRYKPIETRRQIDMMLAQSESQIPSVLLAHHPDTFQDVPADIGLTLSGHTHGGGQVILGHLSNVPIGVATLRFKYLSGLYQKDGTSLYVNRGIGYLGVPIRINCSPEISRFRLIRSQV
jgi:predicted MPP superfamily phosphohydrolase